MESRILFSVAQLILIWDASSRMNSHHQDYYDYPNDQRHNPRNLLEEPCSKESKHIKETPENK